MAYNHRGDNSAHPFDPESDAPRVDWLDLFFVELFLVRWGPVGLAGLVLGGLAYWGFK